MRLHSEALGMAALGVLADDGGRALTHRAVDRRAGVPEGTTSRYARTRSALLELAADALFATDVRETRVAQVGDGIDTEASADVTELLMRATAALLDAPERFRARTELQLEARRMPTLDRQFQDARAAFVKPLAKILSDKGFDDPHGFAELLITVVDGILYRQVVSGFTPLTGDEIHQLLAGAVSSGVRAAPAKTARG